MRHQLQFVGRGQQRPFGLAKVEAQRGKCTDFLLATKSPTRPNPDIQRYFFPGLQIRIDKRALFVLILVAIEHDLLEGRRDGHRDNLVTGEKGRDLAGRFLVGGQRRSAKKGKQSRSKRFHSY